MVIREFAEQLIESLADVHTVFNQADRVSSDSILCLNTIVAGEPLAGLRPRIRETTCSQP